MLVLLWQRPPYSVTILVVGALAGIGLTWLLNAIHRKPNVRPMLLVPGDKTRRLTRELPSLHHQFCRHPRELTEGGTPVDRRGSAFGDGRRVGTRAG